MAKERCGLKNSNDLMGPGSAAVGFDKVGRVDEVRVCPKHAWLIMTAPRGSYPITPVKKLEPINASPLIIT